MSQPTFGLSLHGIENPGAVHWNTHTTALVEMALARSEGLLTRSGALAVAKEPADTPIFPLTVQTPESVGEVDWNVGNSPFDPGLFTILYGRLLSFLQGRELFVQDRMLAGHESRRIRVRVITTQASLALTARNLLRWAADDAVSPFFPDLTVFFVPGFSPSPMTDQVPGRAVSVLDLDKRLGLILGTASSSAFRDLLYRHLSFVLPEQGRLPLNAAAIQNRFSDHVALVLGRDNERRTSVAMTVCAADRSGRLEIIGDGPLSFSEGGIDILGCGTTSAFSAAAPFLEESFGAVIECSGLEPEARNVTEPETAVITWPRASLPPNLSRRVALAPRHLFLLIRDDSGALPPIALADADTACQLFALGPELILNANGAIEHRFDPCFSGGTLLRRPEIFERLLRGKLSRHAPRCWVINVGRLPRSSGSLTTQSVRSASRMAQAFLNGHLDGCSFQNDIFPGLCIPVPAPDQKDIDPRELAQLKPPVPEVREGAVRELCAVLQAHGFRFSGRD